MSEVQPASRDARTKLAEVKARRAKIAQMQLETNQLEYTARQELIKELYEASCKKGCTGLEDLDNLTDQLLTAFQEVCKTNLTNQLVLDIDDNWQLYVSIRSPKLAYMRLQPKDLHRDPDLPGFPYRLDPLPQAEVALHERNMSHDVILKTLGAFATQIKS